MFPSITEFLIEAGKKEPQESSNEIWGSFDDLMIAGNFGEINQWVSSFREWDLLTPETLYTTLVVLDRGAHEILGWREFSLKLIEHLLEKKGFEEDLAEFMK